MIRKSFLTLGFAVCAVYLPLVALRAQSFSGPQDLGQVQPAFLGEISGVAASRRNPGVLWVHNDSGGENAIYAIDMHGKLLGTYRLAGAQNRDWEDIAVGPGPGGWSVYVGEIGDNSRSHKTKLIYRVPEPKVDTLQAAVDTVLYNVERVVFAYPNDIYNAETLMVDPTDTTVYVVNKSRPTTVFRLPKSARFSPVPTLHVDTLEVVAYLLFDTAVGGDISPSGREVLVKTYRRIYYWRREEGESWGDAFAHSYSFVPYKLEPQGEAVGWTAGGDGYVTISEGSHPHIYRYLRVQTGVRGQRAAQPGEIELHVRTIPALHSLEVTFGSPRVGQAEVRVFNIRGEMVTSRWAGLTEPGVQRLEFDTSAWASGVYVVQLRVGGKVAKTSRVVVLR